ncbi:hypothetical protein GCM10025870_15790 [Agromyces marinus]|uniref:GntR C-terminal domain-containing protein n=1 Tax=Agromyces marinus TaxID=1389020 RepID=A0ABN6YBH7_9MICO|nr:hypothetical protein GCM10025870_15790 [Agromyces marinus]
MRPGSGTYLRGTASEMLPQTLSWGILIGERSTAELLELRSGLEIYVARLAAARITDDRVEVLERHLNRMRANVDDDLRAFVKADLAWHHELASIAGNSTLVGLLQVVQSLLRVWVDRAVHGADDARTALTEHEAVFDALRAHDPDAAASAMASHMSTASERLSRTADA